jgi:FkbM family methyltransferase
MSLQDHLRYISSHGNDMLRYQNSHYDYLKGLKNSGFNPKIIYDIGSCVLHWSQIASIIWPDAKIYAFDAFEDVEFLYKESTIISGYQIGLLTSEDQRKLKFFENKERPFGNSYYREIGCEFGNFFNKNNFVEKIGMKLDTVVKQNNIPLPDFVKIDVQGSELDVIRGGLHSIRSAKKLIVELQSKQYNEGAPLVNESLKVLLELGFDCCDPLFCNNGPDGDYGFNVIQN